MDAGRAVPSVERLLSRVWAWEPLCYRERLRTACAEVEQGRTAAGSASLSERGRAMAKSTSNVQSLRSMLLDSNSGVAEGAEPRLCSGRRGLKRIWLSTTPDLTRVTKLDQTAKP